MDEYLNNIYKDIKLDDNQKKAIICNSQNEMIIAGAGSGKTTTMAAKVKYLVDILHIHPENILVIAFTNKAVEELKERIFDEFHIQCDVLTFHKLGIKIIGKGNKIASEDDKKRIYSLFLEQYDKRIIALKYHKYLNIPIFIAITGLANKYYKINKSNYDYLITHDLSYTKDKNLIDFKTKWDLYYKEYKERENLIDFEDMILLAKNKHCNNWKYIIVDEYQDISKERYELLESISANAHLIVVGDDWQAIYAFAGSDVNIFREFLKRKDIEVIKIVNTYRNSQELINLAGSFIMKDEIHIKKDLHSNKRLYKPVKIYKYDKYNQIKLLKRIIMKHKNEKILLLGRFKHDINNFIDNKNFKIEDSKVILCEDENINITFLTVHSAKGLGYDEVIIINMLKGKYGFPCEKENPKFLNIPKDNLEERRLFYVALTRTKNYVYLLIPYKNISPYIKEISKHESVEIKNDYLV